MNDDRIELMKKLLESAEAMKQIQEHIEKRCDKEKKETDSQDFYVDIDGDYHEYDKNHHFRIDSENLLTVYNKDCQGVAVYKEWNHVKFED